MGEGVEEWREERQEGEWEEEEWGEERQEEEWEEEEWGKEGEEHNNAYVYGVIQVFIVLFNWCQNQLM